MWIIDIRHWLNEQKDGPAVPHAKYKDFGVEWIGDLPAGCFTPI
jgi:hypothetical protein